MRGRAAWSKFGVVVCALSSAACGGEGTREQLVEDSLPPVDQEVVDEAEPEPAMPTPPARVPRKTALRSAGNVDISGEFEGWAGLCTGRELLQLRGTNVGEGREAGFLFLVALADSGRVAEYPIEPGHPDSMLADGAARAAFQVVGTVITDGFVAEEGSVTLESFSLESISGTFAVAATGVREGATVNVAGTFSDVPLSLLSEDDCRTEWEQYIDGESEGVQDTAGAVSADSTI